MATRTRESLAAEASKLAEDYHFVLHNALLYAPVHRDAPVLTVALLPPEDMRWIPLSVDELRLLANRQQGILFQNQSELVNYIFMLKQRSELVTRAIPEVLINTDDGLRVLNTDGSMTEPTGEFIPNLLGPKLVTDPVEKQAVRDVLLDWLGDEDTVTSLLHHLATALSPGWSAKKLVLLLGEGRNGKSTLLKMVEQLLGRENVSNITRQQMDKREPAIVDLNNKLANIVFDASSEFIKDSSTEKTLLVGESIGVRLLYESTNTTIKTNALFLEGMNREPLTRDKSQAIQRRITRFHFNKVFDEDTEFERTMCSDLKLGAFLALLLDHFVLPGEEAVKLAQSTTSYDLQIDQLVLNSWTFEFLQDQVDQDKKNIKRIMAMAPAELRDSVIAWCTDHHRDMNISPAEAMRRIREIVVLERKSVRQGNKVVKTNIITGWTPDAARLIERLTEEGDTEDGTDP